MKEAEARAIACGCTDEAPVSVWWRIGGGAFLAMNGMVISMALNGSDVTADERYVLELSLLCIAVPVLALLSKEFLEATWGALRRGQLSIEFLFLLGIVASLGSSALYFVRRTGNGYADVAAMLLVIYALGRQIGAYGKQRVLKSLEEWSPDRRQARRVSGEIVAASQIQPGEKIRVLPGEPVPVDARVVAGSAYVHEASMTGESFAVTRRVGDEVVAGAFPLDGSLDLEATSAGGQNQIDQIRLLIEAGLMRPGQEQALAMRALRWFVPLVVVMAAGAYWLHAARGPWDAALFTALAVVVIACPCALGFATPLAVWTALARLRELGMVARSGETVEKLAEVDTVVFDKTGTLTLPEEYEVRWEVSGAWLGREPELRFLLREAELASRHPLARTLAPLWEGMPLRDGAGLAGVKLLPGVGIEALFQDGRVLWAGSSGGRRIEVRVEGETAAWVELEERHSEGVPQAVRELEAEGLKVLLATGDSAERAAAIPIREQLVRQTPAGKQELMERLRAEGRKVLFVGDGLNDAAALAWSHVGAAAPESVELVQDVSSLVLMHRDWRKLPDAIRIARKARRVVRWNIGFSLVYNVLGMALAATGLLHPVWSAILMMASSLTVILYSMHLMDWEPEVGDTPRKWKAAAS